MDCFISAAIQCLDKNKYFIFSSPRRQASPVFQGLTPGNLLVLDTDLPDEKNGIELCQYLKANPRTRSLYIIFVSASTQAKDIEKAAEAGGDEFYSKPFSEKNLMKSVVRELKLDRSG
ncbi:MAG: response regulator [Nitrospinae bacterium]|nr:response regulator [Nitrospinota bacterium]